MIVLQYDLGDLGNRVGDSTLIIWINETREAEAASIQQYNTGMAGL